MKEQIEQIEQKKQLENIDKGRRDFLKLAVSTVATLTISKVLRADKNKVEVQPNLDREIIAALRKKIQNAYKNISNYDDKLGRTDTIITEIKTDKYTLLFKEIPSKKVHSGSFDSPRYSLKWGAKNKVEIYDSKKEEKKGVLLVFMSDVEFNNKKERKKKLIKILELEKGIDPKILLDNLKSSRVLSSHIVKK